MHKLKFIHIICTDPRIQKIYFNYLKKNKLFGKNDTIEYENPILDFVDEARRVKMIERIKAYRQLHGADTVVLFDHFDCGAYKLNGYKFVDFEKEQQIHQQNNRQALQVIKENFPDMKVKVKYIKINPPKKEPVFVVKLAKFLGEFFGVYKDNGGCEWWEIKE